MVRFALKSLIALLLMPAVASAAPDYALSLVSPIVRVVMGQTAEVIVRVDFLDGFATPGITLQAPQTPPGTFAFTPAVLTREGGSLLRIETAGLAAGQYIWYVRASAPGAVTRSVGFRLEVTTTSDVEFYTRDSRGAAVPLAAFNPTAQDFTDIYVRGVDAGGYHEALAGEVALSTGSSSILTVFPNGPDCFRVYAVASGATTLTAAAPDGYTKSIPVTASIPASPRILSIGIRLEPEPLPPEVVPITNKGDQMIVFQATANAPLSTLDFGTTPLVNVESALYNNGMSYIATANLVEGCEPGEYRYLFEAESTSGGIARRAVPLKVVNDPSRGEITGLVRPMLANLTDAEGTVELHDLSGALVKTCEAGRAFRMSYVAPGTYRLRFVPSDPDALDPQWWANSNDFGSATDVVVTAGGSVGGIVFFPAPPGGVSPPWVVSTTPAADEVGAAASGEVTATFSRPMDPSTINSNTFRVLDGAGVPVWGTVSCADGITARFVPAPALAPGASYTAIITTGAADAQGVPLAGDYLWGFSTAADADTLSEARAVADGVSVSLSGKIVHLKRTAFAYVEEADRSSGMRIQGEISAASDGAVVSLRGWMATSIAGERFIEVRSLAVTGTAQVAPLGTVVRGVASRLLDGLSVTVWGRVGAGPLATSFTLSDGSGGPGVPVFTVSPHGLSEGELVTVTGAAGWDGIRVIHARAIGSP